MLRAAKFAYISIKFTSSLSLPSLPLPFSLSFSLSVYLLYIKQIDNKLARPIRFDEPLRTSELARELSLMEPVLR